MSYFQEYEKLKESKQLIPIGSVWTDSMGPIEVKGFDGTIVHFKDISDVGVYSGKVYNWFIKNFMIKFTRVE